MSQVQSRPQSLSLLERPYNYPTQSDYYKPRELSSRLPSGYSSLDRRPGESWDATRQSSSMTDYRPRGSRDAPAATGARESQPVSSEMNQRAPREQLPSLSSLFGSAPPPPTAVSQNQPSFATRSPPFSAISPSHDRGAAVQSRREYKSSGSPTYFQRPGTATNPQDYTQRRVEYPERIALPPPSRSGSRPDSPRTYEARYSPYETSRPQLAAPSSRWSPHSEPPPRQDYFHISRDTSSSFRSQPEGLHTLPQGHRIDIDSKASYRDSHPPSPQYVTAPGPSHSSDPVVTKDSLGPKIWTGTHFLPRFVREAEVPGEGLCYFYDDGSHCKTVIDGEAVNAHWGVTKAGKPRKRLAIACITCREKKIKCDPDYPRCLQCEKFGRTCRFKNAPRGGHSPDTPETDLDDLLSGASQRGDADTQDPERSSQPTINSPQASVRHLTPESDSLSMKRRKTSYGFTPVVHDRFLEQAANTSVSSPHSPGGTSQMTDPEAVHGGNLNSADALFRDLQSNPTETDPDTVADLIATYFTHMGSASYSMFAVKPFNEWLFNSRVRKSLDDLMLIYTILALASTFSTSPTLKTQGKRFAAISRYACENRPFSLQLVQSRLLLSLYCFAANNLKDSWDLVGMAIRAASKLKLNVEMELTDDAQLRTYPFGLNRSGYAECRRRTFWCCYLIDRFNGFNNGSTSMISADDVFLRMPCSTVVFETQTHVDTPFFDPLRAPVVTIVDENVEPSVGAMAYLISICTVFNDVMAYIYRRANRPLNPEKDAMFGDFYLSIMKRLEDWQRSLPKFFHYSLTNLHRTASATIVGPYTSMHVLYFLTLMRLNRYVRMESLSDLQRQRHLIEAQNASNGVLAIVNDLAALSSFQNKGRNEFSTPLVGFACVCAVDILTSKLQLDAQFLAEVPGRFAGVKQVIDELAMHWQSARIQRLLIAKRLDEVERIDMKGPGVVEVRGVPFVALQDPIEKMYPKDDGLFRISVETWANAFTAA